MWPGESRHWYVMVMYFHGVHPCWPPKQDNCIQRNTNMYLNGYEEE